MTVEEGVKAREELKMAVRSARVREGLLKVPSAWGTPAVTQAGGSSGGGDGEGDKGGDSDDDDDDKSSSSGDDLDPGPEPWKPTYECPRYEEIKAYLIKNKAYNKLAFDSMKLATEPQLYRYIRDFGSRQRAELDNVLSITGLEFRSFLAMANEKEELFM